jgi:hypothetical protein
MIICTKTEILPLKSTKVPTTAAIDNEVRYVGGAEESREAAFAGALEDTLSRERARFNFVFDYPKDEHACSLYSGCTLNKGNWLLRSAKTISEADD